MCADAVSLPDRGTFKATEVCEIAQIKPFILRSWETEFPELGRPGPSGAQRIYSRADLEQVLQIKHLLFAEGLTLAGARRRLEDEGREPERAAPLVEELLGQELRQRLGQIQQGLRAILEVLDGREVSVSATPLFEQAEAGGDVVEPPRTRSSTKRRQGAEPRAIAAERPSRRRPHRRASA